MDRTSSRRSARKRRTNQWDEYELDEDYVEVPPPKRPQRVLRSAVVLPEIRGHCQRILTQLLHHKFAFPFESPVDPVALNIPDYFEKITRPMDFGTIQKKLNAGDYEDVDNFAADVRLVFQNCWTYNPSTSDVYIMGSTLSGIFEKQFKALKTKESKIHKKPDEISEMKTVIAELRSEHQKLLSELTKLVKVPTNTTPTNNGIMVKKENKQKPKKKKIKVKVEMEIFTVKQKKELTEKISFLTPDDLQVMVDIVSSEIPETERKEGEMVIDLEMLSIPTLKKLDQFVNDCLKRQKISGVVPSSTENSASKTDNYSSSSDSDSSSNSSDSESEKGDLVGGKENEATT